MLKFLGFLREEKGATAVEYALILALVAAAVVGVMGLFGDNLNSIFEGIQGGLADGAENFDDGGD